MLFDWKGEQSILILYKLAFLFFFLAVKGGGGGGVGGGGVFKKNYWLHQPTDQLPTNSKRSKHVLHFKILENLKIINLNIFLSWKLNGKFIRIQHVQFKFRRDQHHKESLIES